MVVGELNEVLQRVTRNGGVRFNVGLRGIEHKDPIELAGLPLHEMGMQQLHCRAREERHQAA